MSECLWDLSDEKLKKWFDEHAGEDKNLTRRELKQSMREKMKEMREKGGERKGGPKGGPQGRERFCKLKKLFKEADEDDEKGLNFEEFKNFVAEVRKLKEEEEDD